MKVLLFYTHNPRCIADNYRRAFRRVLGPENVVSVGQWSLSEPLGTLGREPDIILRSDYKIWGHWTYKEIARNVPFQPDIAVLIDQGEHLRLYNVSIPFVYISTEGSDMIWPHNANLRYASLMCNGPGPNVQWWPNAFDEVEFVRGPALAERPIDLTQVATPRAARVAFWNQFPADAPDLRSFFSELWGPAYSAAYRNARCTFVAHGCDFVSLRVFEAMASGCLVISDRTPAMLKLFNEGEHFIGYDPIQGPGGDAIPTTEMIISAVRKINADLPAAQAMADRAYELVASRDSFRHRVEQLLRDVQRL